MKNKRLIFGFLFGIILIISLSTISAENIGVYAQGDTINITNYCRDGGCSGIDLISIKYPNGTTEVLNDAMTMNGQEGFYEWSNTEVLGTYYFKTTGSNGVTNEDSFEITPTGESKELVQLWLRIFLILLSISLIILIHWNKNRIDYDKWYSKITQKYQEKNTFKWVLSALGQIMMKNSYVFSYLVGLLGLLILTDLTYYFNITSALQVMKIIFGLYSWSSLVVVMVFFSQVQEWITEWVKDIKDINWGWEGMQ